MSMVPTTSGAGEGEEGDGCGANYGAEQRGLRHNTSIDRILPLYRKRDSVDG
jgi:hypothetical protein